MPACLSDRIADAERTGTTAGVAEPSTGPLGEKRSLSLAGGFLYIRGVFYMMKPAPGEASASMGRVPPSLCSWFVSPRGRSLFCLSSVFELSRGGAGGEATGAVFDSLVLPRALLFFAVLRLRVVFASISARSCALFLGGGGAGGEAFFLSPCARRW